MTDFFINILSSFFGTMTAVFLVSFIRSYYGLDERETELFIKRLMKKIEAFFKDKE